MITMSILDNLPLWVQSLVLLGVISCILGLASFMGDKDND